MAQTKQQRRVFELLRVLCSLAPSQSEITDRLYDTTMNALRIDAIEEVLQNNRLLKSGEVNVAFNAEVEALAEELADSITVIEKAIKR